LVGVYDADHTLRGELTYLVASRLGRAHCALCDITHGKLRERSDWKECRDSLPVPFETFHRNDMPRDVRAAAQGTMPVVVARSGEGVTVLLGPEELDACAADPQNLVRAIESAARDHGLAWA